MDKKLFSLLGSFATPGGLLALCLAWIATRPDVQARIESFCIRATDWLKHDRGQMGNVGMRVSTLRVPVARSRCYSTVTFSALHAA